MCIKTTGYGLEGPDFGSRQWKDNFLLLQKVQADFGGPHSLLFDGYRGKLQGERGKVTHLFPSSVEIKSEWSYASVPSTCLHGVERDNFTFDI